MPTPTLVERYAGCLLGLACGDALGGPVEFKSRAQIAREFPGGLRDFVGGGWLDLEPGEITDDTQMTLMLAHSLVEIPGREPDLDDVAARFLEWYRSDPKDIGTTTRVSLAALAAGTPWFEAGEAALDASPPGRAAGNGAVMRCAPVALRYRTDPARLIRASQDTARITHADPRCTWGAVALNQGIVHLLGGGEPDAVAAAAVVGVAEPEVRAAILGAGDLAESAVRSGGFVVDTLSAAFRCLLREDGPEAAIVAAVNLGDDADTTGAVAGALAGARYGVAAIPERWLALLQPRDEILALAAWLLARAGGE